MRNESLDMVRRELDRCEIEYRVSPTRGGHWHVEWSHRSQRRSLIVATSPSDCRSHLNTRADLRRILRRDGYAARTEP